jgi:hypothetical protein
MLNPRFQQSLDTLFAGALPHADQMLRRSGFLATALYGINTTGITCSLLEEPDLTAPRIYENNTYGIPAPMREHLPAIRTIFRVRNTLAALMMAEFWTFPADDQDAAFRYATGDGPPPSQHPRRREGVVVAVVWPLGGYLRVGSQRIVRGGTSPYLRPWDPGEHLNMSETHDTPPDELSWVSTWLEEVLPGRDPFG